MVHTRLGTSVADPASGAPPWLVALVLVALTVVVIVGWNRLNRADPGGEPVPVRRSRRYRRFLEAEAARGAEPVDPSPTSTPAPVPRTVEPAESSPTEPPADALDLQGRLALLDEALAAGSLGADEHRVLRTALLEDQPGAS